MKQTESQNTTSIVEDQSQAQHLEAIEPQPDLIGEEDQQSAAEDWQARAEQAQTQMQVLSERLVEVEQATATLSASIQEQAIARAIDTALLRAGVSDLDAARAAVNALRTNLAGPSIEPQRIVERLLSERPGLFARGESAQWARGQAGGVSGVGGVGTGAMAMGEYHGVARAAREALQSGDRRDVLRYLRLRRRQK